MSEQMLVQHCSPTLAGMKTGNMFTCTYTTPSEVKEYVRSLNRRLHHKGLRVLPLWYSGQRVLIYVYRPSRLSRDLQNQLANLLLTELGISLPYSGKAYSVSDGAIERICDVSP